MTATVREIARRAERQKVLAELGGQAAAQHGSSGHGPDAETLREAMGRLKNVESRALDEFFWFWPQDWDQANSDPALAAVGCQDLVGAEKIWRDRAAGASQDTAAMHNLAVLCHLQALEAPEDEPKTEALWKQAWEFWPLVVDNLRFWESFKARIRQVNDPALTTGFAHRLREELPAGLARINATLALGLAQQGKAAEARWHVALYSSLWPGDENVAQMQRDLLAPLRSRLEQAVETALAATGRQPETGIRQARTLLDTAEPWLNVLEVFEDRTHPLFEKVADAATHCASKGFDTLSLLNIGTHVEGEEATACFRVLTRASLLAESPDLKEKTETKIRQVHARLQADRAFLELMGPVRAGVRNPAQLMRRLEKEVFPQLDLRLKNPEMDTAGQKLLSNCVAHFLLGILHEYGDRPGNEFLAKKALMAGARYAREPELVFLFRQKSDQVLKAEIEARRRRTKGILELAAGAVFFAFFLLIGFSGGGSDSKRNQDPIYSAAENEARQELERKQKIERQRELDREKLRSVELLMKSMGMEPALGSATLPLPASGVLWRQPVKGGDGAHGGLLTLIAPAGGGHVYVKVMSRLTGMHLMSLFVQEGTQVESVALPEGIYEIRFARGKLWHGESLMFGLLTDYRRIDLNFSFYDLKRFSVDLSSAPTRPLPIPTDPAAADSF